ncbi:MAG: right-handed parallel beta-helix repeat-containing protein [Planctomycetota bacterium]|nr:right-handed parallel beta-helix repeat-containing protein [Planctomycetota bacterium]
MRRVLATLLLVSPTWAQVTHEVPADFATIQAALTAAAPGDTVLVDPGHYRENLDFLGKTLTLRSRFGATDTIVDGRGLEAVVNMRGGLGRSARLEGFTLINGNTHLGGGVDASDSSPTILGCVFHENWAIDGAGIFSHGSPYIANCLFTRNVAGCYGSAIRISHANPPPSLRAVIVHCTALNNSSFDYFTGAAAISMGSTNGDVINCISRDNDNTGPLATRDIWSEDFGRVRHCNFRTGLAYGGNNLDQPPGFVAPNNGDFHLRASSACRDAGDPAFTHPFDCEGDERDALPDMGCDEHALHLYHLGRARVGNTVRLRLIGATPGDLCAILTSALLLDPPAMTGVGTLYLMNPRSTLVDNLVVPASGRVEFEWTIPPTFGIGEEGAYILHAIYLQAFTSELTNLDVAGFR